jgi:uncharacterized membrane protein
VKKELTLKQVLPYLYMIIAAIGIVVSFWLTYDKIQVLKNPNYRPICDINPILSCGDVMNTKQSNLLGVPNPIFGLIGFSMLFTFGLVLASGSKFKNWLWKVINTGALAGFLFFVYLFSQGVFVIHAICPFCFIIWMITPPILWYTTLNNLKEKNIKAKFIKTKYKEFMFKHHAEILFCWYLIVFGILLAKFWYYWKTLI